MADDKKPKESSDVFIAQQVFPDAEAVFTARLKSVNQVKRECLIVLDTNALLVPYTVSKESLDQIRQTYSRLISDNRLVIPGQVAREFAKNRASKIAELYQNLSRRRNALQFQMGSYPLLESLEDYQQAVRIEKDIAESIRSYREYMGRVLEHICSWTWDDPVSLLYSDLFGQGVVFDPPIDEQQFAEDLHRRQQHKLPPGYKDASKADGGSGDLIIWYAILALAEKYKRSVFFVSGDDKADWWYHSENQALYPRYELVDEFRRRSGGESLHIIRFSALLDLYGASKKAVTEVKQEEAQLMIDQEEDIRRIRTEAMGYQAKVAVLAWLKRKMPTTSVSAGTARFPDFLLTNADGTVAAVEVKYAGTVGSAHRRVRELMFHSREEAEAAGLDRLIGVLVCASMLLAVEVRNRLTSGVSRGGTTRLVLGAIEPDGEFIEVPGFEL